MLYFLVHRHIIIRDRNPVFTFIMDDRSDRTRYTRCIYVYAYVYAYAYAAQTSTDAIVICACAIMREPLPITNCCACLVHRHCGEHKLNDPNCVIYYIYTFA